MASFDPCLAFTLTQEGGYQCMISDSGNWSTGVMRQGTLIGTCRGISAPALAEWLGPERIGELTPAYMQALPEATAAAIYGSRYWLPIHGPRLPAGLDLLVFDHAVNAGVRPSSRLLQAAVGVIIDGFIGEVTLAACAHADCAALIDFLAKMQEHAYRGMPMAHLYLDGWLARLERRQAAAHSLLKRSLT